MGSRMYANEYYSAAPQRQAQQNRRPRGAVEGNVVRKAAPEHRTPERIRRTRRQQPSASQTRVLLHQKHRLTVLGVLAAAAVVGLSVAALFFAGINRELTKKISAYESELDKLKVANDAREFEINSSVDLSYVIQQATENLGMVRCSADQVVTYGVRDSEYLLQLAKVPTE